jgi:4-hydroxyphenylpyruvate dioxygenase-like putative hemolysin
MSSAALDTSSASLAGVGLKHLARQQQEILDVVLGAQRNGARDMSLTEIRDAYERRHSKRIDLNRVSARVSNLVASGRLCRREGTRPCSVTQRNIHPVFVPVQQARLVA